MDIGRLSESQNHRCALCGGDLHTPVLNLNLPLEKGGVQHWGNCFLACEICTGRRAGLTAMDFWLGLHARPYRKKYSRKRWRSNPALKERLSEAQNHRCCYCGERMVFRANSPNQATIEHVQERKYGGSDGRENLVVCCLSCNQHRNDLRLSAEGYYRYVVENGRYDGWKYISQQGYGICEEKEPMWPLSNR